MFFNIVSGNYLNESVCDFPFKSSQKAVAEKGLACKQHAT